MEKKHISIVIGIFGSVFIITFISKLNFIEIANTSTTLVSLALAVYSISISALINSDLSKKLKIKQHETILCKTQLGVLKEYYKNAFIVALITILLSLISELDLSVFYSNNKSIIILKQFFNSLCFSFLSLNLLFIWLIFIFIVNRQVNDE